MENMQNIKFCQSCAMPMEGQQWGTESNGALSGDYCHYCYKDGAFTAESTMEQMIDFCAPITAKHTGQPEEQVRAQMAQYFPRLKRWAK